VVLNICESIGARVPVDLSILVTWRIAAFAVAGAHEWGIPTHHQPTPPAPNFVLIVHLI
jgi:hypothetical protein